MLDYKHNIQIIHLLAATVHDNRQNYNIRIHNLRKFFAKIGLFSFSMQRFDFEIIDCRKVIRYEKITNEYVRIPRFQVSILSI